MRKQLELGIEPESYASLADARDAVWQAHKLIAARIDPLEHKQQQPLTTIGSAMKFADVMEQVIASRPAAWRSAGTEEDWRTT
jgi:hypothetical protein